MRRTRTSSRGARRWASGSFLALAATLAATLAVAAAGCNPVEVVSVDSIRVRVESAPGVSVHLLTSTNFRPVQQGNSVNLELVSADEEWRAAPFDSTFDIRATRRFLVRVLATDVEEAEVEMRVWVDGVADYHHAAVVAQRPMQYVYMGR